MSEQFRQLGLESYLPMLVKERQWSDRVKSIRFPLFPGYVFGRFGLAALDDVLALRGVATVVRHGRVPSPIREAELENVRRFVAGLSETRQAPQPKPLGNGESVRVIGGPFDGVEGIVLEARSPRRVLVGLKMVGLGMEVDIARGMVEPIRLAS